MTKYNGLIIFLAILIISVGLYGITGFGAMPFAKNVKAKKIELKTAENNLANSRQELDNLRQIAQNWSNYQETINLANIALPSDEGVPEINLQMQSLSSQAGLEVTTLNVGNAKTGSATAPQTGGAVAVAKTTTAKTNPETTAAAASAGVDKVNIDLVVKGDYGKFLSLFALMRQNIRPITVESIAVAPDEKGIAATMVLSMPYLKTAAAVAEAMVAPVKTTAGEE